MWHCHPRHYLEYKEDTLIHRYRSEQKSMQISQLISKPDQSFVFLPHQSTILFCLHMIQYKRVYHISLAPVIIRLIKLMLNWHSSSSSATR